MSPKLKRFIRMLSDHIEGLPTEGWSVRRTYVGYIQRSHGAFSFYLIHPDPLWSYHIGSQWPIHELLRLGIQDVSNRYGDIHINPVGT